MLTYCFRSMSIFIALRTFGSLYGFALLLMPIT